MDNLERLKKLLMYREDFLDSKISGKENVYSGVELERLVAKREELKYVSELIAGLENGNHD